MSRAVPLRCISWNLNDQLKQVRVHRWKRRWILRILLGLNPNLICLQEVMKPEHLKWLRVSLQRNTGRVWHSSLWHPGGMCLLSDAAIERYHIEECPVDGSFSNGLVWIQTRGICVASIHLDSRRYKEDETIRVKEVDWILKRLKTTARWRPVILAGDWNSVSHLDSHLTDDRVRCKQSSMHSRYSSCKSQALVSTQLQQAGFVDVHAELQRQRSTWIPTQGHERIDRIYVKNKKPGVDTEKKTRKSKKKPTHIFPFAVETIGPESLTRFLSRQQLTRVARQLPTKHLSVPIAAMSPLSFRTLMALWPTGRDHRLVLCDFVVS